MPKRLIWFLVSLGLIVGLNIILPVMDKMSAVNSSVNTSVSRAPYGYKALYLLIQRLQREPVALWQHSMMRLNPDKPQVIWIVEPGKGLFFDGEQYAKQMRQLVTQGHHFIFLLDSGTMDTEEELSAVLKSLNRWYGISLETKRLEGQELAMAVKSHFPFRNIQHLSYKPPKLKERPSKAPWSHIKAYESPHVSSFSPGSTKGGQVLLETEQGEPLILRFKIGKGSLTVFPNSFYLGNSQLDQADNAPLAAALQEINGNVPTVFEVYSSGFNENRDFITFLATGPGIALLISLILLLVAFCAFIAYTPVRKQYDHSDGEPLRFTQEVFIDSLAAHYSATQDWGAMYQKMAGQFKNRLDRRYPGQSLEIQLDRVAENPFFDVSLEELQAVFAKMRIASEAEFIQRSKDLLEVQRKVSRYEQ